MARITYSEREAGRLLRTAPGELDELVRCGTLRVAATDRSGRPLYDADDLRRAASELALVSRARRRRNQ